MHRENKTRLSNLKRAGREKKTIKAMIVMYCADRHGYKDGGTCRSCSDLYEYAAARVDGCPFMDDKPTCLKCPVHCYKPEMRERVREVMRFSGPRMLATHPILAILHLLDGLRKPRPPQK